MKLEYQLLRGMFEKFCYEENIVADESVSDYEVVDDFYGTFYDYELYQLKGIYCTSDLQEVLTFIYGLSRKQFNYYYNPELFTLDEHKLINELINGTIKAKNRSLITKDESQFILIKTLINDFGYTKAEQIYCNARIEW